MKDRLPGMMGSVSLSERELRVRVGQDSLETAPLSLRFADQLFDVDGQPIPKLRTLGLEIEDRSNNVTG